MRITIANKDAIRYACLHFHYAKAIPVGTIGYNVYNNNDEWCGVVLFGMGATPNIGKPYNLPTGGVLELVRVALNGKQEQTSQVVAACLKQLHKDCPLCQLVVSYADCDQNHIGTIYQATNWVYCGTLASGSRGAFIIHGKKTHPHTLHGRKVVDNGVVREIHQSLEDVRRFIDPNAQEFRTKGKRKYLMPLTKYMRKKIMPLAQPYPKSDDNWQKIDRTQFQTK